MRGESDDEASEHEVVRGFERCPCGGGEFELVAPGFGVELRDLEPGRPRPREHPLQERDVVGDRAQSVCRPARQRGGLGGEERELEFVADGCGDARGTEPLDGASEHAAGARGIKLTVERVDG